MADSSNPLGAVWNTAKEVKGEVGDLWNKATGGTTRADDAANQAKAAQAQSQANFDAQARGIQVQGFDQPAITQHDNWESWDHNRLHQFAQGLQFADIQGHGQTMQQIGEKLGGIFGDLESGARNAVGDGMQGKSADAALGAAKSIGDWGKSFADAVRMHGLKMQEVGKTAEQTHQAMPPPAQPDPVRTTIATVVSAPTFGVGGAIDAGLQMQQKSEAEKQARSIAQNVYTPGYQAVDHSTPTMPPPVDPVNPPPGPAGSGGQQGMGGGGGMSGMSGGGSASGAGAASHAAGAASGVAAPGGLSGSPSQSGSAWAPSQPPPGQNPFGGLPNPGSPGSGSGAMAGGVIGGAGGAKAGGAGGSAGKAGSAGKGSVGAGGRSGSGGAGSGGGAGGSSKAGAAGASGKGGASGGGAGGAGRGKEGGDDEEHETPDWLVESDDVFFNDMPKVAPAVFGEWDNQ
jgi:hypothetical protein